MLKVISSLVSLFGRIAPIGVFNDEHGDVNYYREDYRALPCRKSRAEPAVSQRSRP